MSLAAGSGKTGVVVMMFMMTMILNDRVSSLWAFMERLDALCIFLRFGYICRDIYLVRDHGVPILSIRFQFLSLTVKGLSYGCVINL
jgi:hypothetical protein